MDAEQRGTAGVLDGMMARKAGRYWWAMLISGVGWLLVAWVVLRMDVRSLAAVGVLLGVVFLLTALNEAAMAQTVTGGWKAVNYGIAVAFVLAAAWAFARPINTFFALASVLGLILFLEGVVEIVRALGSRGEHPFWLVGLLTGLLLVLLAFWVSTSDREFNLGARTVLILLWVGFMALFRGISQIGLAFGVRHLARVRPAEPATVVMAANVADIPSQAHERSDAGPARNVPTT